MMMVVIMMMRKQYHNTIFDRCSLCCPVSVPQRVLGTTFSETASIPVTWVLHQLDICQSFYWIVRTISFYFVPSLCRFGNLPWQVLPSPHLRTQAWIRKWKQFVFWVNQQQFSRIHNQEWQSTVTWTGRCWSRTCSNRTCTSPLVLPLDSSLTGHTWNYIYHCSAIGQQWPLANIIWRKKFTYVLFSVTVAPHVSTVTEMG